MACRMHTTLCEVLRWMVTTDRLNPTMLVSGEATVRDLVKLETAVARTPRQPDWDGMEILSSSALTTKGAVDTPGFNSWLRQAQKDRAFIMKQQRLLREEKAAEVGRNKKEKKGGGKGKADEE